jgi:hypothetical protein
VTGETKIKLRELGKMTVIDILYTSAEGLRVA